jgi:hypothetical protein
VQVMTPDSWEWGDPMQVLERKQAQAARKHEQCGQCIHAKRDIFLQHPVMVCTVRRQTYGYRCHRFEIKDATHE